MLGTQQPDTGSGVVAKNAAEFLKIATELQERERAPGGQAAVNPGKQGRTPEVQMAKRLQQSGVFLQSSFKPLRRVHSLFFFK